jgi:glycine oxidase
MGRGNVCDLLIVGGGVIGLSCAWEVARQGARVRILERSRPGSAASWAAAGMLSPFAEAESDGPFLEFGLTSLGLWRGWAQAVQSETGIDVDFREGGKLRIALDEEEEGRLRDRLRWGAQRGLRVEWLDATTLLPEEPHLTRSARGGLFIEADHRVDNRKLTQALEALALGAGVEIQGGTEVRGVWRDSHRIRGVVLQDGSRVAAESVLIAGGAWSGQLEDLPRPLPVQPIRGQMVSLLPERLPSERVLEAPGVYLVPRSDGRLLVGATVETVGYRSNLTAGGIHQVLAAAVRLIPGLADAPIAELWAGLRPGTPDGVPILGPDPEVEGLLYATGHFRNGVLLAPLTARLIANQVRGESEPQIPEAFLPDRLPR